MRLRVQFMSLAAVATTSFLRVVAATKRPAAFVTTANSNVAKRTFVASTGMLQSTSSKGDETTLAWPTSKVRSTFVDFFQSKDHVYQPSSGCAPLNDPTLLFTNAGMNQFKPIFLGQVDPSSPLALLKRAANSQKCIRAGGKHNDLEDVGRDTYHHTFFEMLGSWSFGDYFKTEAVDYAWELLTTVYQLNPDRIYATYFQGDENVPCDTEARDLWLKYLPKERVIGCTAADNFWEMGDTGPCGPCTEIHYDRIGNRDASALVNADDPDVIEIWNVVFIQYNRDEKGLASLPAQHIDTGMGLERLVSILQDKTSNYDIDAFAPLFQKISEHSQVGDYTGLVQDDVTKKDTAYRAIADHARTLCFAIADGAIPNNEGRGYVLRRILRRATRYGQQILKAKPGFFATLVPVVVETFGEAYPELIKNQDKILEIITEEEVAFSAMLERGIKYFDELETDLKAAGKSDVTGEQAFFLYDTLGFPIDLTELMAADAGLTLDSKGFADEMEAQKQRSRDARSNAKSGGAPRLEFIAEQTAWLKDNGVEPTDDGFKYKMDVELPSTVLAIFNTDGFFTDGKIAIAGDYVGLVLDKSSYYAEAGGQEADVGSLALFDEAGNPAGWFIVTDVQTFGGFLLHTGRIEEGSIEVGAIVKCQVDYERRRLVTPNHSMTHVLNAALAEVLGAGIDQRGSLCNEEKLRFDFSYKKAMTASELQKVEDICQRIVTESQPVTDKVMPLAEATSLPGVRAVFGEVYPDPVRVVSIGESTSIEFCGGTHVANTNEAEAFVIVEETAVAKGIRRISAVTRDIARQALAEGSKFAAAVTQAEALPSDTPELDKKAGAMRKELDESFMSAPLKSDLRGRIEIIQKRGIETKKALLAGRVDRCLNEVKDQITAALADGKTVMVMNVDIGADAKASQKIMNAVTSLAPNMAFMGITEEEVGSGGKVMAFAIVPDGLVGEGFKANDWVASALEVCGGRGGGKAGNAQGQAPECGDVDAILLAANKFAQEKVGAAAQ